MNLFVYTTNTLILLISLVLSGINIQGKENDIAVFDGDNPCLSNFEIYHNILNDYRLIDIVKLKKVKEILSEIHRTLLPSYNDTIETYLNLTSIRRDSIQSNNIIPALCEYSIKNGFIWYTSKTDIVLLGIENWIFNKIPCVITTNKLKACYWLWQILSEQYDDYDLAYLKYNNSTLFEYETDSAICQNIHDISVYDKFSVMSINSFRNNKIKFIKISVNRQVIQRLIDYCLMLLKKVDEIGFSKLKESGLPILPYGFSWVKFRSQYN